MWHTVSMIEWTETLFVDGLKLRLVAGESGIRAIEFHPSGPTPGSRNDSNPMLRALATQLQNYFAGDLRKFDLPLDFQGTDFQKRVWRELETIPYGETRSYAQIDRKERRVGKEGSHR